MRCIAAFLVVLPLAACLGEETSEGGIGFVSPPEENNPLSKEVLNEVPFYNGRVVVTGPKGYCVDGSSITRSTSGSVALIAGCDTLTGKRGAKADPAVMTVSIAPRRAAAQQPTAEELAASAGSDNVIASEDGDGISLVRLGQGGNAILSGGEPRYWRAAMMINGHMVSLAAYTPKSSGTSGKALIMALAENLREFSPIKDFTPAKTAFAADAN